MPIGMSEKTKLWRLVSEHAGLSRRKAQALIDAGEVEVDGTPVREPFLALNPAAIASLRLRGHPICLASPDYRVYRYHKPRGVLCSHDDPHSGNTLGRILRAEGFIGYTWAGRLDADAEGLLVLTNDGELVNRMTHPRYGVEKTYQVTVASLPPPSQVSRILQAMRRGIVDEGETLRIAAGRVTGRPPRVVVTLTEGRKHEVKRLFSHAGLTVVRLRRVGLGPVRLRGLAPGAIDRLGPDETEALRRACAARPQP